MRNNGLMKNSSRLGETEGAMGQRDSAIELATQICDALDAEPFDRMRLDAIDAIIEDLRALKMLMRKCSDADLAITYLQKMKRSRADKSLEGQRAKDAAVGARIMAYNLSE